MTNVKIASTYHIHNANVTLVEPATVIKVTILTQILLAKWLFFKVVSSARGERMESVCIWSQIRTSKTIHYTKNIP